MAPFEFKQKSIHLSLQSLYLSLEGLGRGSLASGGEGEHRVNLKFGFKSYGAIAGSIRTAGRYQVLSFLELLDSGLSKVAKVAAVAVT